MSSLRTRFVTAKATLGFTLSSLRRIWSLLPVVVFLSLSACSDSPLDPAHPVTLTLWHVYGAQTYSPMNELVDVEKELARLAKEIEKAEKNITGLKGKLSNQNFVSRAPENVVNAEREKLEKAENLLQQLKESEARLKK